MFRKASKSVCISTVVVFPNPLSPSSSKSLAMKAPENAEEDPDEPEPADEVWRNLSLFIGLTH